MAARQPLLNILNYWPGLIEISPVDGYNAESPHHAQIQTTFSLTRSPEAVQKFVVTLFCRCYKVGADENLPYAVNVGLAGEFYARVPIDETGVPRMLAHNALIILYGVARGIVGQHTGGGINGRMVLPTIVFDDLMNQVVADPGSGVIEDPVATPDSGEQSAAVR